MKAIAKGYVLSVERKYFWCRLEIEENTYDAQIAIDKLGKHEKSFLQQGAYLSILKGGSIRFSRLRWKKKDIVLAKKRAEKIWKNIWNKNCHQKKSIFSKN